MQTFLLVLYIIEQIALATISVGAAICFNYIVYILLKK